MRDWPVAAELSPADSVRVARRFGARRPAIRCASPGDSVRVARRFGARRPAIRCASDRTTGRRVSFVPPRWPAVAAIHGSATRETCVRCLLPVFNTSNCFLQRIAFCTPNGIGSGSIQQFPIGIETCYQCSIALHGVPYTRSATHSNRWCGGVPRTRTDGVPCDSITLESVVCESGHSSDRPRGRTWQLGQNKPRDGDAEPARSWVARQNRKRRPVRR